MSDKFIYTVLEDGELIEWFVTLDAAQAHCERLSAEDEDIDLLIIEIPVRDILKFER